MARDNGASNGRRTRTATPRQRAAAPASEAAEVARADEGAVMTAVHESGVHESGVALGPSALPLGADATDEMLAAAPVFGDVLKAVGLGVAASQAALDKGVRLSVESLKDTPVRIVTDVITTIGDDGQPKAPTLDANGKADNLRFAEVSALNFFTPTVHEWKHVSLSMDLTVGEMDSSSGVRFSKKQASVKADASVHWGFFGWFASGGVDTGYSTSKVSTTTRQETDFAQGSVRLDAELGPRRVEAFPVPGRIERGPVIVLTPGPAVDAADKRTMPVTVRVRKADGSANANKSLVVTCPGVAVTGTTLTDADGTVDLTLEKVKTGRPATHTVDVRLGDLVRTFELTF